MLRFIVVYSLNGEDIVRDSGQFAYLENKSIIIPSGAGNLRLTVQYLLFIGIWQDLILNMNLRSGDKYACFFFNINKRVFSF